VTARVPASELRRGDTLVIDGETFRVRDVVQLVGAAGGADRYEVECVPVRRVVFDAATVVERPQSDSPLIYE
jgi:translation elongation factor P/translation initiation factor 5A